VVKGGGNNSTWTSETIFPVGVRAQKFNNNASVREFSRYFPWTN